ncbi:PREDICTED: spermatogenesis-associated protein 21 [Miniopterus natalensis]|uniref:spermatogenesis-associated protein 21 n=1 Tax=Miniopterus natalensis TaxID=291302 RepID=UPI0007A6AB32|nr:PREDICTED: spermatogenesis-associated protein 21 [Miniopterus natalensis]
MDNRNTQVYSEDRIKSSGAQPSPGLRTARKSVGVEPAISEVNQVMFPDATGISSGKEPSSAPEGPEKRPGHGEASEEGPPDLRTQEQSHLEDAGKKLSSCAPQEGPEELQVGQDQTKPGSELGVLPSRVPAAPEGLQQEGAGKETKDLQGTQQNPETVEDQAPERSQQHPECQPTPGPQAADESDIMLTTEPSCTLDSGGQRLEDKPPKEAGSPHIRPQGALPEPGPGGDKGSSQEALPLIPTTAPEEKTDSSFPPPTPGPNTPKEGVKAVETKPAPGPVPLPKVRDFGERRELDCAPKQPQEPTATTGAQSLGRTCQGFMRCLLEVEEEEATHRRATKVRALQSRKSPRTLTPMTIAGPLGNAASGLHLTLPQAPASASAMAPSWARTPAPGPIPGPAGAPVLASVPVAVLPAPTPDLGWRRMILLHQGGERSLSHAKARQELEERCLLNLYQNWEERAEEHLTLKQEEAFHSYFEVFNGHGEVDARSLENVLLLVGMSLTPAQVKDALLSADIDGDGHVGFKDFLAVMTDTKRFFCSVEQNALTDMVSRDPHTLFFEILSLLVEMLALPETALEEITNYYQKKLKEGTCKAHEMESAIGRLQSRKKLPYNLQQADTLEVPERRVLRILSRLKQQNYAANLQSPYAQVPCIPLCPRLDKKTISRKQGSQYVLDQCTPTSPSPDFHSLFFQSGSQGSREHGSDSRKWLNSVPARTH